MVMSNQFSSLNTSDNILQRIQSSIEQSVNPMTQQAILGGNLLQGIALKAGVSNSINTGLGKQALMWIVVDKNAASDIWKLSATVSTIVLDCTADCTISLWVA